MWNQNCWNTYDGLMTPWIFTLATLLLSWQCLIMLFRCQLSFYHTCNIFNNRSSCKWIFKRTYAKVYPYKQHASRPGSWLTDPIFVVQIWWQAAMILKEIDVDMRNKIVKIKRIFEKPEHHYKLRGHLLDLIE